MIDWLLHARKLRWHVYLVVQHYSLLDKQVRDSVMEMVGTCRRLDRAKFPLIPFRLPKIHVCTVRYGTLPTAMKADAWWYRSHDLYAAYDTGQVFTLANNAPFTMLSAYHLVGRYLPPPPSFRDYAFFFPRLVFWVIARFLSPNYLAECLNRAKQPPPINNAARI
jgi:hypothetical protein